MRPSFATLADVQARHPREIAVLAANETTRLVDEARVTAALADVSTEIRAILAARYTAAQIDDVDEDSAGALRLFAIDMALYRVSLNFNRQTDAIKARYDNAVKRLEGIASGKGGLTMRSLGATGDAGGGGDSSPNEAIVIAEDRVFSRRTLRGL